MLVHLEHRHAVLAEDGAELVVGDDLALVLRILKIVLLDMVPDLADDLAARQRAEPVIAASSWTG